MKKGLSLGEIILVTGGSRSGKSDYARLRAEAMPGLRAFVATCPVVDDEMAERICRHQREREASQWHTIEETTNLPAFIRQNGQFRIILVDCLTLWINNLMYAAEQAGRQLSEDEFSLICGDFLQACALSEATVLLVTNEVGMGIVPSDPTSRRYRDMVGRCNQIMAQAADEVILVVCGIAIDIKAKT